MTLDDKAESETHLEFITIELPKLEAEDGSEDPNMRP
jgi:hypothetical protein